MAYAAEEWIGFHSALLLQKKGFKGDYDFGYDDEIPDCLSPAITGLEIPAPTQQVVMRWLRETHNIFIQVCVVDHSTITMEEAYYFFKIFKNRRMVSGYDPVMFKTYEECVESAIEYCLEKLVKDED